MDDSVTQQTAGWTGLLDRLWRTGASPRFTVVLFVWLVLVLTLSLVVPQAPPHLEDPLVRSQWLASVPMSARPVVERLQTLGLFDLLASGWLRLPLALMLAHALVMLAHLGPATWQWVIRPSFADNATQTLQFNTLGRWPPFQQDWPEPVEHVGQHLAHRLEKLGCRVLWASDRQNFVAWRWRWSWLALMGAYLGLGLSALGVILAGWLGQVQEITLEPDTPTRLSISGAPSLVLDRVTAPGRDPLQPTRGLASLQLVAEVGESRRLTLPLHHSRWLRGSWLTLVALKPVVEVTALDTDTGQPVLLQPFSAHAPQQERVRLPLTDRPEARFVGIPSENATLRVDYRPGIAGKPVPAFQLLLFQGAEASPSRTLSLPNGGGETVGGIHYRVILDYNPVLRVHSGLWWLMTTVGWGIAALSFVCLMVTPPLCVWGQVTPRGKSGKGGSQVTLMVEALGDRPRLRREMKSLVAPE